MYGYDARSVEFGAMHLMCYYTWAKTNKIEKSASNPKILEKTKKNTAWEVKVYRAWAKYRKTTVEILQEEYPYVPLNLQQRAQKTMERRYEQQKISIWEHEDLLFDAVNENWS